jgi:surface protein
LNLPVLTEIYIGHARSCRDILTVWRVVLGVLKSDHEAAERRLSAAEAIRLLEVEGVAQQWEARQAAEQAQQQERDQRTAAERTLQAAQVAQQQEHDQRTAAERALQAAQAAQQQERDQRTAAERALQATQSAADEALALEREKNAELVERVRALEAENEQQKEMLRRHQERWQRVRAEYAKKQRDAAGATVAQQETAAVLDQVLGATSLGSMPSALGPWARAPLPTGFTSDPAATTHTSSQPGTQTPGGTVHPRLTNDTIRQAVKAFCDEGGGPRKTDFLHSPRAEAAYGPVATWDVSAVTDMNGLFKGCKQFNQPLEAWSVDNVTDMRGMFYGATAFNQPLEAWSVDNVTDMSSMFNGATAFNQPLEAWSVDNVTDMSFMFSGAAAFNQPLEAWSVDTANDYR